MKTRTVLFAALLTLLPMVACARKKHKLTPEEEAQLRTPEAWLAIESARLLRDYVRLDTSEAKGEEAGAQFLQDFFRCAEIESEIVCPAPKRCNLLARLPGRRRQGSLLLLNHIDIASTFPKFWKEAQPFEGKIRNGYLYGRGTYDMKSLALAQSLALRNLKRHGIVPGSDILFLAEADEELGQRWGARWLLEHRSDWFAGVEQVLNEGGTNELILRDVRFWGIETIQAGFATGEFQGKPETLKRLAARWERLESRSVEPHPHVVEGFDMLANHLLSPLTDPLRHLDRVARHPEELAILPDRYGSFLEARIFWSPPYASPPDSTENFRCYVIVSVPPGVSPASYLARILADASRGGIAVTHSFASEPTSASPYPTAFTDLLKRVTEAHYPGIPFGPVPTFGAYTTSILFRQKGIPTYGYSPIPMNITDAARRHGLDERIYLRDYVRGVELYEDILEEFALSR